MNADFLDSIPVQGQSQYNDFFAFMGEVIPKASQEAVQLCGGVAGDYAEWDNLSVREIL
jgi:hypothetical protein